MNIVLETIELGDFFARLMLNAVGGIMGLMGIALPNIVRGIAPSESYPILNPITGMSGQLLGMLSQVMGLVGGSIPVINF